LAFSGWAALCAISLGREPGDYDIATSARPEQIEKLFKRLFARWAQVRCDRR